MKQLLKLPRVLMALALIPCSHVASADTVGPFTQNFDNLVTGAVGYEHVYSQFSIPRFDSSLGTLEKVHLAFDFSGTVIGSASGVSESSAFDAYISHWVFFDMVDVSDNVGIGTPSLRLMAGIPSGSQNTTIEFGPEFQSSTISFSVGSGDPRFEKWQNGPGEISGRLGVYFGNTSMNASGLQFLPGTDAGTYNGQLSVSYEFTPVPEPTILAIGTAALLMLVCSKRKQHPADHPA